jgi:hypothetical protein
MSKHRHGLGFGNTCKTMNVPSCPARRKQAQKYAAVAVSRMGIRENRAEYPVPKKFKRWRRYYFHCIELAIQKQAAPQKQRCVS